MNPSHDPISGKVPAKVPAKVVALSGGIGGAKLALGLYEVLAPGGLTVICNPGDDFEHFGLTVCPDFDTVLYTLSGLANPELGWGRAGETWSFMAAMAALGGETWFNLGDGDVALHLERSNRLRSGECPTTIARALASKFCIRADLLPPCDTPVRTMVATADDGDLPFQRYFVQRRCEPKVRGFRFEGASRATLSPSAAAKLADPDLDAIVICPSNPYISIDPILAVPGMTSALAAAVAPVIAVSPLIKGDSVKGPTAKMMRELGIPSTNAEIAAHYGEHVDGWLLDHQDVGDLDGLATPGRTAATLMTDLESKTALARACLAFAASIRGPPPV